MGHVIEVAGGATVLRVDLGRHQSVMHGDKVTITCPALSLSPLRDLGIANLPVPTEERESLVMAVLALHRRALNCRACTGCDWEPEHPGGTSNAEATRRRNTDFNTHLAHLIVTELA